jgi:hypothetical protein
MYHGRMIAAKSSGKATAAVRRSCFHDELFTITENGGLHVFGIRNDRVRSTSGRDGNMQENRKSAVTTISAYAICHNKKFEIRISPLVRIEDQPRANSTCIDSVRYLLRSDDR